MSSGTQAFPALDDLQSATEPVWLWDAARRRIIWSNAAGLAFFGAESLFDLIDRRFSQSEPGVLSVMRLANTLAAGETVDELLDFPSAVSDETLSAVCRMHKLPDGRNGVLVVGRTRPEGESAVPSGSKILDTLPHSIVLLAPDGQILQHNASLLELFDTAGSGTFAALVGDEDLASEILRKSLASGTFSQVTRIRSSYGLRDLKVFGQVLGAGASRQLLVMFEDVTERRALERRLREHAEHLSDFVASAADFTWELDRDLVLTRVSEGFEEVTGLAPERVIGATWRTLGYHHGFDRDGEIRGLMEDRSAWKAEVDWTVRNGTGESVRLILSAVPVHLPDGEFTGYRGIGAEISRRVAEAALSDALSSETREGGEAGEPRPEGGNDGRSQEETAGRLSASERSILNEIGRTLGRETNDRDGPEPDEAAFVPDVSWNDPSSEDGDVADDEDRYGADEEDGPEAAIDAVRAAFDGLPHASIVHRDGEILHLNPLAACLLGFETQAEALKHDRLVELFGVYADGLLDPYSGPVTFTSAPFQSGPVQLRAVPGVVLWPDGDAVQVTLQVSGEVSSKRGPATAAASPDTVVRSARDGTKAGDRSEGPTNSDLLAMLNTITDGIMTLDHEGRVIELNAGAEAMFGYESDEVRGRRLSEFLKFEIQDSLERYMAAVADPGIASVLNDGREVAGIEKNGGEIPLFLTLGRLQGSGDREPMRFCAVLRDLTSWKRTETELIEARRAAEFASAQKSEFLANISHELRTPLNAILGFSEVMKTRRFGEIDNDRYSSYVNDIHSSGEHLLSLVNDLLDLSKVEAGKLELDFSSVGLGDVISQSVGLLSEAAKDARVIVRSSVAENLPDVVADPRSMHQIMLNLLSNAIKFTDPGGQVVISAQPESGGLISLKVKDTGRGMTERQIARAMEPFLQVENAGDRPGTGTGLGLPLTRALAEANRASFDISSEPEVGTVVKISFPATRVLAE